LLNDMAEHSALVFLNYLAACVEDGYGRYA